MREERFVAHFCPFRVPPSSDFDDWPFLWGQNEGTIAGNTQYVIFGSSFKNLAK